MAAETILELKGVVKGYPGTPVLNGIDLTVSEGEFVAILGFSGTGKTTLMSLMAGLTEPDSGQVLIKGKPVTGPGVETGLVFQSYSLFPWLSVEGNVALAVNAIHTDMNKTERAALIQSTIELVGLGHASDRKPAELSGGMRQRVAVARALAMKPEILLLDEPLSALDALTRAKLQAEIDRIRAQEKRTIILITNDVDEALLLADRVAILEPATGKIREIFDVTISRPREKTALNHDAEYKALRSRIANYLGSLNDARTSAGDEERTLPNVTPITALNPPQVYLDAAKSGFSRRYLEFFKVKKVYPTAKGPLTVVEDFTLLLDKGDFVSLIGHSGCGKSTALTMAAGLSGHAYCQRRRRT